MVLMLISKKRYGNLKKEEVVEMVAGMDNIVITTATSAALDVPSV